MASTWLFLDISNLAWRAFFAGNAGYDSQEVGVAYGILRDIVFLQDIHSTDKIAFCFDRGEPKRKAIYPAYKLHRNTESQEIAKAKKSVRQQIRDLYNIHLREIGFRNLFSQSGYEADDLLASLATNLLDGDDCIIVTTDSDLFQLLGRHVRIWNPIRKQMVTEAIFREQYGIGPTQWVDVKALAGCPSDNIEGIRGIGEKTAIRHLQGKLDPKGKAFKSIIVNTDIWGRNLPLIQLPFKGTKICRLKQDAITQQGWKSVTRKLGIRSLGY